MTLPEILAIVAIVLIVGGALAYIIKAKKSGKRCIGCPDSASCSSKSKQSSCGGNCHSCSCGCSTKAKTESDSSDSANASE